MNLNLDSILRKRKGLSVMELMRMIDTEDKAIAWWEQQRWEGEVKCPSCSNTSIYRATTKGRLPYRCRVCLRDFSVRTGTVMGESKLSLRKWVYAIYAIATNIKGTSSTKLGRDIGVRQATAWHLLHRIRKAFRYRHARGWRETLKNRGGGRDLYWWEDKKLTKAQERWRQQI